MVFLTGDYLYRNTENKLRNITVFQLLLSACSLTGFLVLSISLFFQPLNIISHQSSAFNSKIQSQILRQ